MTPVDATVRPVERADCVLVARSGLGTLNHTLLSLQSMRARHLEPSLLLLVGEPHDSNRATLETMGTPRALAELPLLDLGQPLQPTDTQHLSQVSQLAPVGGRPAHAPQGR